MRNLRFLFVVGIIIILSACQPNSQPMVNDVVSVPVFTATPIPPPTMVPEATQPMPTGESAPDDGSQAINIYLVAIGDNGASGKPVGCGDSLVPVEVRIAPTAGMLRAALEELIKLQGQAYYGGSGLFNALHQSDLSIMNVSVVGGMAVIELKGMLLIGGTCDIPRVQEQLRALALQFETVSSLRVIINGKPLEEVLELLK